MFAEPYNEPERPKLKLELVRGGGGGGGVITAVGCNNFGNNEPEPVMEWQEVPAWFSLTLPITTKFIQNLCVCLPMAQRDFLLRRAGLPRCYRLLLSVRWKFLTDEDFSSADVLEVCDKVRFDSLAFKKLADTTETQAVWRVWSFCTQYATYPWNFKDGLLLQIKESCR